MPRKEDFPVERVRQHFYDSAVAVGVPADQAAANAALQASYYAQRAARETAGNLRGHNLAEIPASRGESAYVVDMGDFLLASITECLGTKVLIADAMRPVTGKTYFDALAQDTLAMAINDIITVGATPIAITVDGYPGRQFVLTAPERPDCDLGTWVAASRVNGVGPSETNILQIVDVDGERVMINAAYFPDTPPETRSEQDAMLESVHLNP